MARPRIRLGACAAALSMGALTVVGAAPGTADGAGTATGRIAPAARSAGPTCGGVRPHKPGGGRYKCTFTDDFNGSKISSANWMVTTTDGSGITTNGIDCYRDDPRNVSVGGGTLKLTARVESKPFLCHEGRGGFWTRKSAGSVLSWGKFGQAYGRFEFRAKFPTTSTPGIDSALWMYPMHPAYGRWPASGELDVAEWFGNVHGNHVYPSLHYAGQNTKVSTGLDCAVNRPDMHFHTYAVEWTKSVMRFYYDDTLCYQHSWTPSAPLAAPQPFDKPFDLVMTQTAGRPGFTAVPGTRATMVVDWVRAWH